VNNNSEPLSLSAMAKVLGRAKSGLHRLARKGQIPRLANGKFDLAAVQAALKANLEPSRAKRVHSKGEQSARERVNKKPVKTPEDAAEAVSLIRGILEQQGAVVGVVDFQAVRTALLILQTRERALRMEVESGRLCDVDTVRNRVFALARADRDALQNWPSRISAIMASELGVDPAVLVLTLERHLRDHLVERSDHALRSAADKLNFGAR
jgi:hypothetical protein